MNGGDGMKKDVSIKYSLGHTINSTYSKTDMYCPECGEQEVWKEESEGDWYVGPDHSCTFCKNAFTIQEGTNENDEGEQLIEQLKK